MNIVVALNAIISSAPANKGHVSPHVGPGLGSGYQLASACGGQGGLVGVTFSHFCTLSMYSIACQRKNRMLLRNLFLQIYLEVVKIK